MVRFSVIFVLFSIVKYCCSARILCFYPVPFHSHQLVFEVLTKELLRRGHELVVIAGGEHQMGPNVTQINIKNNPELAMLKNNAPSKKILYERYQDIDKIKVLYAILNTLSINSYVILRSPEVQALVHNKAEKFDLILIEECIPVNLIIAAKFEAPIIFVSSYYASHIGLKVTGAEINPIYHADNNFGKIFCNSFAWEKLTAFVFNFRLSILQSYFEDTSNDFIKKNYGENTRTVRELRNNVQMMVLNTYQFWDFSRPVPPSVLYTGGMHLQEPKPLPEELKNYLDNATSGVLYMSFGSKFQSSDLPEATLQVLINVFVSLPYKIVWKLDGKLPGEHTNIRVQSWFPQNDLLHHPSIKVFITHAGLQSTDEAIAAGVPLIALPIIADQFTNANNYVLHGIGIKLDIKTFNEKDFTEAIFEIATNERNNIKRLGNIMRQHRTNGLNKTMHYIDYVLKHGNVNFHSPAANLLEEYYQFDVIAFVIVLLLIVFIVIIVLFKILFCKMKQLFEFKCNGFKLKYE